MGKQEQTLLLIKPDAFKKGYAQNIIKRVVEEGFKICRKKRVQLSPEQAEEFYSVHKGKPFFKDLIKFITSGEVLALVLEKDEAVDSMRRLIGPTDPKKASRGEIRGEFGEDKTKNAVHASDSQENARREIEFFFPTA